MVTFISNPPAEKDSVIVETLRDLGAVPFCHTNLPQTMFSINSSNPIFGITTNPYDKDRTSGGSSSGEGVMCALRGSVFGIGADIGGSIRIPAGWCGGYGIKVMDHTRRLSLCIYPLSRGSARIQCLAQWQGFWLRCAFAQF